MRKISEIEKKDIILFKYYNQPIPQSHLRNFINFLISKNIKYPIHFSHAESEGQSLLKNLSLKENIYLERPQGFKINKETCMKTFLKANGNEYLIDLFESVTLWDEFPDNVDNQTRKLVVLLKALLLPSTYLFLESPEKHLDKKNFNLFAKALEYRRWSQETIIFISSPLNRYWENYANKEVCCSTNQKFIFQKKEKSNIYPINFSKPQDGYLQFTNLTAERKKDAA